MPTLAEGIFNGHRAESDFGDLLMDANVPYDRLAFDWYDGSVEIHGLPPEYRLTAEAQRIVHSAGFHRAYCNHTDKWETHYKFDPAAPFSEVKGWRVSYPHKRGEGETGIYVEAQVPSWPAEWFETGYAVVMTPPSGESDR